MKKCDCKQETNISDLKIDNAKLKVELENLEKTIDTILKAIFGNGNPGLKTKLEQLISSLKMIKYIGSTSGPVALLISAIALYFGIKGGL